MKLKMNLWSVIKKEIFDFTFIIEKNKIVVS